MGGTWNGNRGQSTRLAASKNPRPTERANAVSDVSVMTNKANKGACVASSECVCVCVWGGGGFLVDSWLYGQGAGRTGRIRHQYAKKKGGGKGPEQTATGHMASAITS
jgi:hypothetical protein